MLGSDTAIVSAAVRRLPTFIDVEENQLFAGRGRGIGTFHKKNLAKKNMKRGGVSLARRLVVNDCTGAACK